MRFLLDAEQRAFAASLDAMLTSADTPSAVRAWAAGDPAPGRVLWSRLADAGVFALAVPEAYEGVGPLAVELAVAFVELGRHGVPGPLVETVTAAALLSELGESGPAKRLLPPLASGEAMATVALPGGGPWVLDADTANLQLTVSGAGENAELRLSQPRLLAPSPAARPPGGPGTHLGADAPPDTVTKAEANTTTGADSGPSTGMGTDADAGAGGGASAGTSTGTSTGAGADLDAGTSAGTDTSTGAGAHADADADTSASTGAGADPDASTSAGTGAGAHADAGTSAGTGAGADPGAGAGTGQHTASAGAGIDVGRNTASAGAGIDVGRYTASAGAGIDVGRYTASAGAGAASHRASASPPAPRPSLDPARHLALPLPGGELLAAGPHVTRAASRALTWARLATAAQALGVGLALLDRTVAHVKQRSQFGVPIGSFQAVKHQLADAKIALEFARPLLFGAALSMVPADVAAAKVRACEGAYGTARTALQLHGAIGYTAEYDLSLWLTKARALRTAWGSPAECRAEVLRGLSGDAPLS